jgi:hypothetical protein
MVELDIVERLLGVPADYPRWRIADMANRAKILPTWLSSVIARGGSIGSAATEYLDRISRRVGTLHRVGAELAAAHQVSVIKGAKIAHRMPTGLLRNSGDTDIVAQDQQALWKCVLDLRERYAAVPQGVNVLSSGESLHVVVAMKWPAEASFLDKPMGADICTCAFCGDMKSVPVRTYLPEDDDLCSLFAVAEERFQRKFSRKDMLDLVVLADALDERFGDQLPGLVADTASQLNLAPELLRLIRKTTEWVELPAGWTKVELALEPAATAEKDRRTKAISGTGIHVSGTGIHRLRFGFPLDDIPAPDLAVRLHEFGDTHLMSTPLGTCLLVDTPTIPAGLITEATERARSLSRSGG